MYKASRTTFSCIYMIGGTYGKDDRWLPWCHSEYRDLGLISPICRPRPTCEAWQITPSLRDMGEAVKHPPPTARIRPATTMNLEAAVNTEPVEARQLGISMVWIDAQFDHAEFFLGLHADGERLQRLVGGRRNLKGSQSGGGSLILVIHSFTRLQNNSYSVIHYVLKPDSLHSPTAPGIRNCRAAFLRYRFRPSARRRWRP